MELDPVTRRRAAAAIGLLTILSGAGWWLNRPASASSGSVTQARPPRRLIGEGTRVRVEVLNASEVPGLARRATIVLRDVGFDVVRFAGDGTRRDSTVVVDRTGHPDWARLAGQALGGARVEVRPDSGRYVDLTILLGATWRPPPQPFHP